MYMTVCPVFFFLFVLFYQPLWLAQNLDLSTEALAVISAISLAVIAALRLALRMMRRLKHFTWACYVLWCIGEMLAASLCIVLYVNNGLMPFFYALSILVIPYTILTMAIAIAVHHDRAKEITASGEPEKAMACFVDVFQRPKLVVDPSAVLFIEAKENYVIINYLEKGEMKKYELRATMASLEEVAERHNYIRCQRSFYVNPSHVKDLRKETGALVYAELDEPGLPGIPVSKRYYDELAKSL